MMIRDGWARHRTRRRTVAVTERDREAENRALRDRNAALESQLASDPAMGRHRTDTTAGTTSPDYASVGGSRRDSERPAH